MGRSRKLTLTDWSSANTALMQHFEGNKSKLTKHLGMSRTTVTDFFSEKAIGEGSFRKICLALRLHWEQVSSAVSIPDDLNNQSLGETQANEVLRNEDLIEQVKEHCRQRILEQHSQMRLLSGEDIGVDQLYVDVWLLEKPERRHFNTPESILSNFDVVEDRLALGKRIERNPGFEIANSKSKLVILGKPGSGKTTFLKHLAIDWCKKSFQHEKIAVLVELRRIQKENWNLFDAITQELQLQKEETLALLRQGKLLVLMDGLDEVPTHELRRNVQVQVKDISDKYSNNNRVILTCRTQIMGTIPSDFSSVEVADFSSKQVRQFVQNWFTANGLSDNETTQQCDTIQHAITNQPDLREMTATPVLLSLICVVWQDSGAIPTNRNNLYKRGITY